MKAKFFAILLSLSISSMTTHASVSPKPIEQPPSVTNKIDLNKTDVAALTGSFKGIGKKRAEAIIAYRDSHHGFKSIEELADVKGLGQHFVDKNRDQLNQTYILQ